MSHYSHDLIDRLGFECWCDSLLVDQIENITTPQGTTTIDEDGMSLRMSWSDNEGVASFRAHTRYGWMETTKQFKLPYHDYPRV